jgi:hypothetical protein
MVTKCNDLGAYTACTSVYIELMLKHYSEKEVLILLRDLVKHIVRAEEEEKVLALSSLQDIITLMLDNSSDLRAILTSEWFMKLMDVFKPSDKTGLCKRVLRSFAKQGGGEHKLSDPVLIHTLFDVARSLHDSIDSLSIEDERRQISDLICGFIERVDFGRDLEQQLSVLVDCRAAFPNLELVKDRLVLCVTGLAMRAHVLIRGKHNKKTSAFVKGCLAYCHITVPSIDSIFSRLNLFLLCAQVSLVNGFLPQTDTFMKAAISLVPDVPEFEVVKDKRIASEPRLLSFLKAFLAVLVVVPAHPENGPFYLVKGLLNAVARFPWQDGKGGFTEVCICTLPLLCSYAQRELPYRVAAVESNDVLYGGSDECRAEVCEYLNTIVQQVLVQVKEAEVSPPLQARLITRLLNVLMTSVVVNQPVANLMARLFQLAKKHAARDPYLRNTMAKVGHMAAQRMKAADGEALARLSSHIQTVE